MNIMNLIMATVEATEKTGETTGETSLATPIVERIKEFFNDPEAIQTIITAVSGVFLNILIAIVIFFIGKFIASKLSKIVYSILFKTVKEKSLPLFVSKLSYYFLVFITICIALGKLGVETSSLIAILGTAGLAIGLALQGSLSNFASGTLIIIFRPFSIGDFIEAGGNLGTVVEIGILATAIATPDNKRVIIPNSAIMGSAITNYTANTHRRVDFLFGVDYKTNIELAKKIILEILEADERVIKDNAERLPMARLKEMADSSLNIVSRCWVKKEVYWDVFFDVQEKVKAAFDKNNISIPFPQRDIHLYYKEMPKDK